MSACWLSAALAAGIATGSVAQSTNRAVTPEARLFSEFKNSVFTVRVAGSKGSGFLVDPRGLIATNHHVIAGSARVKLETLDGRWFEALVVAQDQNKDLALLRVHPEVVAGAPAFRFPDAAASPPFEGERILAIGSPLNQTGILTTGIVSKVGPGVLMSDVNINPGNSGGPVLNLDGHVVGVATFADLSRRGPGVSGVVSAEFLPPLVERAAGALDLATPPSPSPLPQPRDQAITPEELDAGAKAQRSAEIPYLKGPRNFRTEFETPFNRRRVVLEDLREQADEWQRTIGRRYKDGNVPPPNLTSAASYFWERFVGPEEVPAVAIKVVPVPKATSASLWGRFFGAMAGVQTKTEMEFRDDFTRMEFVRDGQAAATYDEHRMTFAQFYSDTWFEMSDMAFGGYALVDPLLFRPGGKIELRFWKNDQPKPTVIRLSEDLRKQVWEPFEPWAKRNRLL